MRKEKDCGKKVTVIEASEFWVVSVNKEILIHKQLYSNISIYRLNLQKKMHG